MAPSQDEAGEAAWSPAPVLRGRRGRRDRTGTLIALTLAGIALAALKPWGIGSPASSAPAVAPSAVAAVPGTTAPQPTAGPVIADRNAMTCLTHQVEQVLTLERWPDREIKSWSQPDGAAVTIASSHVVGIGVCPGIGPAVAASGEPLASRNPEAWGGAELTNVRLLDGKGRDLGRPPRITEQTDYVAAGVLYGPPITESRRQSSSSGGPGASGPSSGASGSSRGAGPAWRQAAAALTPWPAGRYEISYVFPGDPAGTIRTVVVLITTPLDDS